MKTLAELKAECSALGLTIPEVRGRPSKEPYIAALRDHYWQQDHPPGSLPPQILPMLLDNWADLDPEEARRIEHEPGWVVQPKLDGVRALLHIEGGRVRINSRCVSEVTYRLGEFQDNLPHLTTDLYGLVRTILDTGRAVARHPLQATTAILSTSPDQARRLQARPEHRLRFHAFDLLRLRGVGLTRMPLCGRLDLMAQAFKAADNRHVEPVPTFTIGRLGIHHRILDAGGEGTVWKRQDQPYERGRRIGHWLKRKAEPRSRPSFSAASRAT